VTYCSRLRSLSCPVPYTILSSLLIYSYPLTQLHNVLRHAEFQRLLSLAAERSAEESVGVIRSVLCAPVVDNLGCAVAVFIAVNGEGQDGAHSHILSAVPTGPSSTLRAAPPAASKRVWRSEDRWLLENVAAIAGFMQVGVGGYE
jgi:hypothetical protein